MMRTGSWWLESKDPRWCVHGTAVVGGFVTPPECEAAIERLRKELGEEPPDDLEWGYMKD